MAYRRVLFAPSPKIYSPREAIVDNSMHRRKFANSAAIWACLLVITAFTAKPSQLGAESPATESAVKDSPTLGSPIQVPNHTVRQLLDGRASLVGHYSPEQKLRLTFALTPPHMSEEEQFLRELTTKGSPNFHKFLTADGWNARFAPAVEDEQKVVDWAKSQGFTITNRYPNRLLVDVEAPAGVIEKAFGINLNNYKLGEEVDFANDRNPLLPSTIANLVQSVMGLNNIQRFHNTSGQLGTEKGPDYVPGPVFAAGGSSHGNGDTSRDPRNRSAKKDVSKPIAVNGPPLDGGAADPDNIASSEAYNFDGLHTFSHCCNVHEYSSGSPAQSSIALVTFGDFHLNDVATFFNRYGFAYNLSWYYINGSGFPAYDGEAPLDVEYATAMSNSYGSYLDTSHVYVYEASNYLYATYADVYNAIASNNYAKVVSTSYGWEEGVGFSDSQANSVMHGIFNSMIGQGFTLIAAAGDQGASTGCGDAIAVSYPASDPDFIAAGGTTLQLDSNGDFVSETAWEGETYSGACASNHGGGGGGISANFAGHGLPEISLNANPDVMGQWYYYNGWQVVGGTDVVAPEVAGFFAQENSLLDYIGYKCGGDGNLNCTPVGPAQIYLGYVGEGYTPHLPYYDTTSGCNRNDVTGYYGLGSYCAATGYDLATGWGSANMMQLAWAINFSFFPFEGQPTVNFSGPATNTWYNTDQTISWSVIEPDIQGIPSSGVAGFTQGWDSIPDDPQGEPNGGSGNSFYSGPEFPFATAGCLDLTGIDGCGSGVPSQGCHTVVVRGWDNEGATGLGSYGPVCFDSVAPTTSSSLVGTLASGSYYSAVNVILNATDGTSGVQGIYYELDGVQATTYSAPLNISSTGTHTVKFWANDVAGNLSAVKTINFKIAAGRPAALTTPTPGSTLAGSSVMFKWSAGTGATGYELWLGSTKAGSKNLHSTSKSTSKSATVNKLPTNGKTIFARLITFFGAAQVSQDYTYKAK